MVEWYDFKLIQSGKHIEVYEYMNKRIFKGYTRKNPRQANKKKNKQKKENTLNDHELLELMEIWGDDAGADLLRKTQKQKTQFSIARTRRNIRRLTNANDTLNKFLTLTFAKPMPDVVKANKIFNTAMKRIQRRYTDFSYIAVIEFQKDTDFYGKKKEQGGSVHYHLLCNIALPAPYAVAERFMWERHFAKRYWKQGFVKVKDVTTVTNMGAYFCKYLSKDMFDPRMFNKKKFFCSQNLEKPVEMTGTKAKHYFSTVVLPHKAVYETTFKNEHIGTVNYTSYLLN